MANRVDVMKPKLAMHSPVMAPPFRGKGFSIIELMVAMTIGLVLLAGLFYVYIGASQSSRFQGALASMQTNARYAFELMGLDVRMLGFTGSRDASPLALGNGVVANNSTLCPMTDLFGNKGCTNGAGPLIGYENSAPPTAPATCAGAATECYLPNTDSFTVARVDTANKYALSAHAAGTSFTLSAWPTSNAPTAGEIFVAADYSHAAVFQVSSVTSASRLVSYSGALGTFSPSLNALGLYRLSGVSYYIRRSAAGEPTLYRDKLTQSGGGATSTSEELIQGIENMQITYGVDTSADVAGQIGDGNVDGYWTASQINANTPGIASATCTTTGLWKCVLSIRITLSLVSGQNERVGGTGDRLLRKIFTNTIAIRNRLP